MPRQTERSAGHTRFIRNTLLTTRRHYFKNNTLTVTARHIDDANRNRIANNCCNNLFG